MTSMKGMLLFGSFNNENSEKIHCSLGSDTEDENDVDSGRETSLQDVSMEGYVSPSSELDGNQSLGFIDSGFLSPAPVSTPAPVRTMSRFRSRNKAESGQGMGMKLTYDSDVSDTEMNESVPSSHSNSGDEGPLTLSPPPSPKPFRGRFTPPHKGMRALRLFDTPHTPKSLLEKAQSRSFRAKFSNRNSTPSPKGIEKVEVNINPFTPSTEPMPLQAGKKRARIQSDESFLLDDSAMDAGLEDMPSSKKIALHEINTSRYNEEFVEVSKLGNGEFGCVLKCINRLDGCAYAIKKSKTPVAGSAYERNALNEVYAHAVLGKHAHVVRYYSAWAERDHMYIQNEFCNGGSLADAIAENNRMNRHYTETELKQIFLQIAQGLKYIHSQNLVHLDIKPGNIFIHRNPKLPTSPENGLEEDSCDVDTFTEPITYKIGDLGHVTSVTKPSVEEGDCRYLPNEILQENFDHLPKADVFALALTIFVAAGGGSLPKNGDDWHFIRGGNLPYLDRYSKELNSLLQSMIHPDPTERPSSAALVRHPVIYAKKSRAMLRKELNEEKFKNEILSRKLHEAETKQDTVPDMRSGRKSRLIGKRVNRSMSVTYF